MKKRFFTFVLFLGIFSASFASNLRDYVCVVSGNYSQERIELLDKMATNLQSSGYMSYAEIIKNSLKGSFGSGFVYYTESGKAYVVTNRHVLLDYQSATVSFENPDSSTSEYKNLKILDISSDYDLALIELPEDFSRKGLKLYTKEVQDGDEIFSAGFPGLGGKPSWQLGKGIVSNSRAKIEELLDPSISTIIQHTAALDGGNSGGPLLIQDSKSESGYLVVGVNTWKAYGRENTNFAIPAPLLKKYITEVSKTKNPKSVEEINKEFYKSISSNKLVFGLSKYISDDMVRLYGEKALKKVHTKAPSEVRSEFVYNFSKNPFDAMKSALSWCILSKFYDKNMENFVNPMEPVFEDSALGKKAIFKNPETDFSLTVVWQEEDKIWKIYKVEDLFAAENTAKKNDKLYFDLDSVYTCTLNGGVNGLIIPNPVNLNLQFLFDLRFISFGADATLGKLQVYNTSLPISNVGIVVRGQVPLKFNNYVVIPFAGATLGIALNWEHNTNDLDLRAINWGVETGVENYWCTSSGYGLGFGMKYKMNCYKFTQESYGLLPKTTSYEYCHNITVYVSLRLSEW